VRQRSFFFLFSAIALLVLRVGLAGAIRGMGELARLSGGLGDDPQGTGDAAGIANYGYLSGEVVRLEGLLRSSLERFREARQQIARLSARGTGRGGGAVDHAGPPGSAPAMVRETSLARAMAGRLTPWVGMVILGSALALGMYVRSEVIRAFEPELAARTKVIGAVANQSIQRAVSAGIPLTDLVGAESFFDDLLRHFPEVSYFGVATGRIVYEAGTRQKSVFGPARSQ
jgi:hypothetical protein